MTKRLISFDLFRGFMIGYVIILHPIIQRVFVQDESQFESIFGNLPWYVYLIIIPVLMFSIWGSAFIFITGATTAYQLINQLQDPNANFKKIYKNRWLTSLIIYGSHWIYIGLFINHITLEHPITTYSLITGYLETGTFSSFNGLNLLTSSVLETIAFTGFIVSLIFYFNSDQHGINLKRIKIILSILSIILFLGCAIFQALEPNPSDFPYHLWNEGNYLGHYILMHLFVVRFPLFPVVGFGFIGALFGIFMTEKKGENKIISLGIFLGGIGLGTMIISIQRGFNFIAHFALEIVDFRLQFLNIGLQSLVTMGLWYIFDYKEKSIPNWLKNSFIRYSSTSLTIFLFEALNSILVYNLILAITNRTELASSFPWILIFDLGIALEWFLILWAWDKKNFRYSVEWWIFQVKIKIVDK
jgi:hypothetical protein